MKQPFYSIRFNSREDLEKLKLEPGDSLFFSPDFSEMVKIDKLLKQKGCDASWEDDKECPDKFLVSIYWGLQGWLVITTDKWLPITTYKWLPITT